jgi:hypothetical protein
MHKPIFCIHTKNSLTHLHQELTEIRGGNFPELVESRVV